MVIYVCKMIIYSGVFPIFLKILIFWVYRGGEVKGVKNGPECQKIVCRAPYLRNSTSYDCHLWCKCEMIISPGVFFNFSILILQVVRGLKGQKMAQNDKNFCLLHFMFQKPYMIFIYGTHVCIKGKYHQAFFFFFFKILVFRIIIGGGLCGKRAKKAQMTRK